MNKNENEKNNKELLRVWCDSERQEERTVMPILPEGKIQSIFKLNKRSGRSLEFFRFLRKNRDDAFVFTLAAVLCFAFTGVSRAGVVDSGTCNNDGTCLWSLDSEGTLTVSAKEGAGKVQMENYICYGYQTCSDGNRPWEANIANINNIVIGDNITNIGDNAFQNAVNLKTVSGMSDLTAVNNDAFVYDDSLTNFTVPDSVTTVGEHIFWGTKNISEIIIPDSWGDVGSNVSFHSEMFRESCFSKVNRPEGCPALSDMQIVCKGETSKCEAALAKFKTGGTACSGNSNNCLNNGIQITSATEEQCTSSGYYWSGASCNNKKNGIKCAENFKKMEDWCNRIRYTPAAAAKVLHDDNTNSVTITFKK